MPCRKNRLSTCAASTFSGNAAPQYITDSGAPVAQAKIKLASGASNRKWSNSHSPEIPLAVATHLLLCVLYVAV
jgi:hypothetical protein